ncbi:MAG: NAD-dependent epimerase/dehydratase family protein [Myxococcota bacterium]
MRIAVSGGAGQLGSLVLRRLVADRRVREVVSLDLRPPIVPLGKLSFVRADVREPAFARHIKGCDALAHLAFIVTRHAPRAVVDAVNVEGSKNVFRAAAAAGVSRIVHASSIAAYGILPGHPVPLVESAPRRRQADFAYAATKFDVEAFLDDFEKTHPEIAIARMRPSMFVGARMEHPFGRMLRRRAIVDLGGGVPLPIVWDEDAADAFVLALLQGARGAFNLSAEEHLVPAALARAGDLRLVRIPRALVLTLARASAALARTGLIEGTDPAWIESAGVTLAPSSARARADLGWRPRCPTAADVVRRFVEIVPERADPRIALFLRLLAAGSRDAHGAAALRGFAADVHLCLTGRGGGDFALRAKDGRVRVARGAPRPPTAVVTMPATLLLDLLAGRGDFTTAEMTGRVVVEGEGLAGLFVAGIIGSYRAATAARGGRGLVARAAASWIARP